MIKYLMFFQLLKYRIHYAFNLRSDYKKTTDRNSLKVPESPNYQRVNQISTDEVLENTKLVESNL